MKKKIIAANDYLKSARDDLNDSGICLPNLNGEYGDIPHSIVCAENAIRKIQKAIRVMKGI